MLKHVILSIDFNCTKISLENLNIRKSNLFVTIAMLMLNYGICAISPLKIIPKHHL